MKDTLVVNLFAGPGSGKSTFTGGIFWELKWDGVDCEMALEYAKDLVWEGSTEKLAKSQGYVYSKQHQRLNRVMGKVDVIITDSPILLSTVYDELYNPNGFDPLFRQYVLQNHNRMRTVNFFIERHKEYNPNGRLQSRDEAISVDRMVKSFLDGHNVPFVSIPGEKQNLATIVNHIKEKL
jgi:hypothetical protein